MTMQRRIQLIAVCPLLAAAVCLGAILLLGREAVNHAIDQGTKQSQRQTEESAKQATAVISRIVLQMCRAQGSDSDESLRKCIMDIKVGKSGYVFVLGGSDDNRGHYIISKGGKRDGEDISGAKDADGVLFIQEMVSKATALKTNTDEEIPVAWQRYAWKNPGEENARMKIAALTYYAPRGWVIGAGAYEDDYADRHAAMVGSFQAIQSAFANMTGLTVGLILALLILSTLISIYMARRIAQPLAAAIESLLANVDLVATAANNIQSASREMADGSGQQAACLQESTSTLDSLAGQARGNADAAAQANQLMTQTQTLVNKTGEAMQQMVETMSGIKQSSDEVTGIVKTIEEIAFQTNLLALNAAVEAARAGEHGKGFAVVAEEVRNLAQRAAEAARNTAGLIHANVQRANEGTEVVDKAADGIKQTAENAANVAGNMNSIAQASNQQAQSVDEINGAVAQMEQVTRQVASNSQISVHTSEQLAVRAEDMMQTVAELTAIVGGQTAAAPPGAS